MPQRNKVSKKRNSGRKAQRSSQSSSTVVLKRIEQYEKTQTKGRLPQTPDIPKMVLREKLFTTQRTYSGGTITPSTTIDQTGSISFALNQLSNFSEFTNLFDQYRIVQVTVTFVPTSQVSTSSPLVTFIDRDDASTLTAVTQCYEFPSCQISESGCLVERTFTPRPATAAYSGVFTSFTSASAKIWIDAASAGVLYYGLKWYNTAQTGNNTSINWDIVINLTMQFQFVH